MVEIGGKLLGVVPAQAGLNRTRSAGDSGRWGGPRTRGAEPGKGAAIAAYQKWSPHTRG